MEFTLKVLTVVGCWPPDSWTSSSKRAMYNVYTAFITLLLFTFMIPQLLDIILNVNSTEDFADTFYILLAIIISCDFRKGNLTYREWTPYNYSETVFYVIYIRQLISATMGSLVNVACDSLICGFVLHICCQIEILECRLRKIALDQKNLRIGECVRQHDCIFKFAFMINEHFKPIIAIQFIVSMLVVCSNLYQLAKITLNTESFPLILYTVAMLTQILIYCWFGNEVKIKSVQLAANIFEIEWLKLDRSSRRDLLIIMSRSLIPIEFSSAYVITMNVDSFVSLLKTSYSAYNLLQQMEMA